MRGYLCSVSVFLAAIAPAFAFPGENGHIAFSQTVDRGTPTSRGAIFLETGQQLTFPIATTANGQPLLHQNDYQPAWSPDGSQLAYVRLEFDYSTDTPTYMIMVIKKDGTGARRIVSNDRAPFAGYPTFARPAWT